MDEFIKIFRLDYLLIDTRTGYSVFSALGHFISQSIIVFFRPNFQDTQGIKDGIKSFEYHRQNYKLVCSPVPNLENTKERLQAAEKTLGKKINIIIGLEPLLLLEERLLIVSDPEGDIANSYRKIADNIEMIEND